MSGQPTTAREIAQHMGFVRRVARDLVRDAHLAEDLSQNALAAALEQRPSPTNGLQAWFVGVLRNLARVHFRSESRRSHSAPDHASLNGETVEASTTGSAAETVQRGELSELVVRSVMKLDEPYRTVVLARYLEEKTPPEIAAALDRPLETVQTQLRRGLQRLRSTLDAQHGGGRDSWLAALVPLADIGAVRSVASHGAGVASSGVAAWFAASWRWVGLGAVAVVAIAVLANIKLQRQPLPNAGGERQAVIDGSDPTRQLSARAEAARKRAAPAQVTPAPSVPAVLAATGAALSQPIRVVEESTGRPIVGAQITVFDLVESAPAPTIQDVSEAAVGVSSTSRPLGAESAFAFDRARSQDQATTAADRKVKLAHAKSRAGGDALLVLSGPGLARVIVEADGFSQGFYEISASLTPTLLELTLERAGGIEFLRGDVSSDVAIGFTLMNDVLDVVYPGELASGEEHVLITDLAPGAYQVIAYSSARRAAEFGETGTVMSIEGQRTTHTLRSGGPVTLAAHVAFATGGAFDATCLANAEIVVRAANPPRSFRSNASLGAVEVPGLPEGALEVSLVIDGNVVSNTNVAGVAPTTRCTLGVPVTALTAKYESASAPSPYWSAVLRGPLDDVAIPPTIHVRDLERSEHGLSAGFNFLPHGAYDLWALEDSKATCTRIEVTAGGDQPMLVTLREGTEVSAAIVTLTPTATGDRGNHIEVFTDEGLHLPFPHLAAGDTLELPPGSYTFVTGWPRPAAKPLSVDLAPGRAQLALPSLDAAQRVRVTAIDGVTGASIDKVIIEHAQTTTSPTLASRDVHLSTADGAELMLAPGSYRARDAHGRTAAFTVGANTGTIHLQMRL